MKNTKYLIFLIFALAIVGIGLDKSTGANQEIILKFTEQTVTEGDTEDVIRFVKNQLKGVATGDIQIKKALNGTLKITYHSDIEIAQIKAIFSQNSSLVLETNNSNDELPSPIQEDLIGFQLDVFEIQTSKDFVGFTGTVVEFKTESIRFFTPDVYALSQQLIKEEDARTEQAYHTYTSIALAIDDSFCTVPQVRAGPILG